MEFYATVDKFIVHNKENNQSLWCCKLDGSIFPRQGDDFRHAWNPICHGITYGVIGKIQLIQGADYKLLIISDRRFVGHLPGGHEVFKVEKVAFVTLAVDAEFEIDLKPCPGNGPSRGQKIESSQQKVLQQTWNSLKSTASNQLKGIKGNATKEFKDREKLEKRLLEELLKMFNESGSFYYSPTGDLSNTMQRLYDGSIDKCLPIWNQVDDRFFWNKHMLQDLISMNDASAKHWILPIMQGHFEVERCTIDLMEGMSSYSDQTDGDNEDFSSSEDEEDGYGTRKDFKTGESLKEDEFDIVVISRRSRHRAGTRYKRRGVDENGNCANYVETEQIVCVMNHFVSFVQVRGSVPVFWSQPGYKYRPPPLIDKDEVSTQKAFSMHFNGELTQYKKQVIINLVEQGGREKIIGDAFLDNIILYNSPNLRFVNFDFHEYCRGMKFHNVAILIDAITDSLKEMRYCWVDDGGLVADQQSVFRVNCMDCLDRTNVVQATIARAVLETLLRKLGRLMPEHALPFSCRRVHNHMWANNGDAISRQYAGTAAMKGDYTRTGERKLTGLMKDGYKSANRYYLNRFRDTYRQAIIDIMLGNPASEDFAAIAAISKVPLEEESWTSDKEECIAQIVVQSQKTLIPPDEECLGGWALVDPLTFSETDEPQDEDVILLLTVKAYYVGRYDDSLERVVSYQRILLKDLEKIEIGPESHHCKGVFMFMRLHHRYNRYTGYFHTMRTVQNRTIDEARGILLSIAEMFVSACRPYGFNLRVMERQLDKRRAKRPPKVIPLSSKRRLSKFSDMSLPDIESPSKNMQVKGELSGNLHGDLIGDVKSHTEPSNNVHTVVGSCGEYETWVSLEPEGEIVERRRTKPLPKSASDPDLNSKGQDGEKSSKIDFILNKTRNIFNTENLKKSVDLLAGNEKATETKPEARPTWEPDIEVDGDDETARQSRFRGFTNTAFKFPLRGLQDKFKDKNNERSAPRGTEIPPDYDNSRVNSGRLRILDEIRNRFASSPKLTRKIVVHLSPEEIERRRGCKTEIIDI